MSYTTQAAQAIAWLVLTTILFGPLERLFAVKPAKFFRPGWWTDFGWYFLNHLTPILLLAPPSYLLAMAIHAVIPPSIAGATADLPLWARASLAMVVGEFGFYWGHRWCHEVPLLWRFHAIHHSAEHIDYLVNTRAHPVDMVFTRLCGLALLYATGLISPAGHDTGVIMSLVLIVGSAWSFFIHANIRLRLGPLEELIATPAFHHWHHTREDHKDHNYASMLPVMDRIFGTFYLPKAWPAAYGTNTHVPTGLLDQLLDPFAPAPPPSAVAAPATAEEAR